jgi:hypothetical protein
MNPMRYAQQICRFKVPFLVPWTPGPGGAIMRLAMVLSI